MPRITVRYVGPSPVSVPAWALDLAPGQVVTLELDDEQAAALLADASGHWQAVDEAGAPQEKE